MPKASTTRMTTKEPRELKKKKTMSHMMEITCAVVRVCQIAYTINYEELNFLIVQYISFLTWEIKYRIYLMSCQIIHMIPNTCLQNSLVKLASSTQKRPLRVSENCETPSNEILQAGFPRFGKRTVSRFLRRPRRVEDEKQIAAETVGNPR